MLSPANQRVLNESIDVRESVFISFLSLDLLTRDLISFPDDNLFILLIDFFLAGISNTTSTVDILLLQMANHQDVQKKLHEEIDAVIGRDKIPELSDRPK